MCHQACISTMKERYRGLVAQGLQVTDTMEEYVRPLLANRLGGYVRSIHRRSGFDVLGMVDREQLDTLGKLETSIREDIEVYVGAPSETLLQTIFIKIQMWLGYSGTFIFTRGRRFNWNTIRPYYQDFVMCCLAANGNLNLIQDAGRTLDRHVTNVGISQISVHIHFWSHATMNKDALPIFNTRTAPRMGVTLNWDHILCYWNGMRQILSEQHLTNMNALDRQIILFKNPTNQNIG